MCAPRRNLSRENHRGSPWSSKLAPLTPGLQGVRSPTSLLNLPPGQPFGAAHTMPTGLARPPFRAHIPLQSALRKGASFRETASRAPFRETSRVRSVRRHSRRGLQGNRFLEVPSSTSLQLAPPFVQCPHAIRSTLRLLQSTAFMAARLTSINTSGQS